MQPHCVSWLNRISVLFILPRIPSHVTPQEWLQVHHALRSVVRKIEGDYGNEDNLNTRATAIMSNLQERALAEANAKAEVQPHP